ncbi:MAG: TetR/AcrR family transcriptional regulator [Aliiglaciecola sp.]
MARKLAFERDAAIEKVMFKIWQDGYHAASVKALSELLGITRSSFYHTFVSREALFKEVLSVYSNYTPLQKLIRAQKGDRILLLLTQTLNELCHARANDTMHRGCLAMNSVAEICGEEGELTCHLKSQLDLSNSRIEELLFWAQEQGEIDQSANVEHLALAITNLFIGLNIMSKAISEYDKLWAAARTTLVGLSLYVEK